EEKIVEPVVTPKEEIVQEIDKKIKEFKEEADGVSEEIDIPQPFFDVASKQGWTEDEIMDFVGTTERHYTDEELIEMIPLLNGEEPVKEQAKSSDKVAEPETKEAKVKDSQADENTKKLLDRIEALEKAQGKSQEDTEAKKLQGIIHQASQTFDDKSKEFEIFGKTEELPKFPDGRIVPNSPQMKARNEVFDLAYILYDKGVAFDKAMETSLNAYKGKNLSSDVKRSIIKDLKKNEKRLSGKHTSHESNPVLTSGAEVIREVARRHGREIL
ncbi:MAG: hypothetical protein IMZ70_03190, partial [Candidatus Atribacteria bacterium]|nr:hypothetical protein [Candidatus Atribacteria bacterium]